MAEDSTSKKCGIERFLEYLQEHVDDRGMMADLRHGFSRTTEYRAWPHVAPWCDLTKDTDRRILLTVAAGFALHKRSLASGNLGTVLRRLATCDGRGLDGLATFDARFRRFLSCSGARDVCDHLPGVLRAAERKHVPVDFAKLHWDLTHWGRYVKVAWAREYWGEPRDVVAPDGEGKAEKKEDEETSEHSENEEEAP